MSTTNAEEYEDIDAQIYFECINTYGSVCDDDEDDSGLLQLNVLRHNPSDIENNDNDDSNYNHTNDDEYYGNNDDDNLLIVTESHTTSNTEESIDERLPEQLKNIAKFYASVHTFNPAAVHEHFADSIFGNKCTHCGAYYSDDETTNKTTREYNRCCQGGKVKFNFLKEPIKYVSDLLDGDSPVSKLFHNEIRKINTVLGFSSTIIKDYGGIPENSHGPPVLIIQGNIMHKIGTLYPENSNINYPQYMQSYFWEPSESHNERKYFFAFDDQTVSYLLFSLIMKSNIQLKFFEKIKKLLIETIRNHLKEENEFFTSMSQMKDIYDLLPEEGKRDYKLAILDYQKPRSPARTHNAPQSVEVSALMKYDPMDPTKDFKRAIVVYPKGHQLTTIYYTHASYLPLSYPLFHMKGEHGWHTQLYSEIGGSRSEQSTKRNHITIMEYASYILHIRDKINQPLQKDIVLNGGKLTQQYILDLFICMESDRLSYLRRNQYKLKASSYKNLVSAIAANEEREEGMFNVLPSSYIGGPRWFHEEYQDAMARVRAFHKPDLFITFTCNPKWPEIIEALRYNQKTGSSSNRPDIISRVFDIKLNALLNDLRKDHIFGEVVAILAIVEWQKRNLPHAHILLFLHPHDAPQTPQDYDKICSAELPNKTTQPQLFDLVTTHMIHGPCGIMNPYCVCMKDGRCQKKFPKQFNRETTQTNDSYPKLRRRSPQDGGHSYILLKGNKEFEIDNAWVVPYNPYLTQRYQAHINVEICNTVGAVKYLHKYIYKGISKAIVERSENNNINNTTTNGKKAGNVIDEIKNYVECRYLGPAEAANRIFSHTLHSAYPPVVRLQIHLPGEHFLQYEEGKEEEIMAAQIQNNMSGDPSSMLLAYFAAVKYENDHTISEEKRTYKGNVLPEAKHLSYQEFPAYFSHNASKGVHTWKRRVDRGRGNAARCIKANVVSRLRFVKPSQGELLYLRMLLVSVKGATSFDYLKTVHGVTYGTFKEACTAIGLIGDDQEWDLCLQDATHVEVSAFKLRQLYCIILVNNHPQSPEKLWTKYKDPLSDDFFYERMQEAQRQTQSFDEPVVAHSELDYSESLHSINDILLRLSNGEKSLSDFNLPLPSHERQQRNRHASSNNDTLFFDSNLHKPEEHKIQADNNVTLMNEQQNQAFTFIIEQINCCTQNRAFSHIFLDAPGGTGKTFVINTVISRLIEHKIPFVASAYSGIAAILLTAGRTTHAFFKLPISKSSQVSCNVGNRSGLGRFLKSAKVVIIDEAPMLQKEQLEAIHILFHQLNGTITDEQYRNRNPFANKLVILSGDFRQTLPVCPKENRAGICSVILKRSYLWSYFKTLHLSKNERVLRLCKNATATELNSCNEFANFVLSIGNGLIHDADTDKIYIPSQYVFNNPSSPTITNCTLEDFVKWCYPEVTASTSSITNNYALNTTYDPPLHERAILCPLNKDVDCINAIAISLYNPNDPTTFVLRSADSILFNEDDTSTDNQFFIDAFPTEHLNTLSYSGVPPHEIVLKPGVAIILLRNLDVKNGLCNGTKLIFLQMKSNFLMIVQKINDPNNNAAGNTTILIPRIDFIVTDTQLPFHLKRRQFPIKLAFAITINKSQGQSLKRVGVYLPRPLFSHGQLYVAIGRSGLPKETYFFIENYENEQGYDNDVQKYYTKNIVWREILQ